MKCYYEELCVERDANESEIKTAYRKLALKWHPDKNLDCLEEAKERFQLIQQAYEVLSDPQERAWYDNHREQILRGKNSNYEDSCLDVFQYFTVSCFKGYGDDDKGFYAVYREVFEKISAEDAEFMEDEEDLLNIPKFGDSKSSYEEIVGPFYAYWSAYCTKRTYTWLCPYDITEIKDRRILREIEKDMKKIVQKARRERNEEVRNLVSFIRKRDKRVQAYKKLLEERAAFNRQKHEQNRLEQIKRRQQELEEMKRNSKTNNAAYNDDYEEKLKELEQQYSSDEEYYDDDDDDNDDEEFEVVGEEEEDLHEVLAEENGEQDLFDDEKDYIDELYCVACNKEYKTKKAFTNHQTSKKHQDNVEKLKVEMQAEENSYQNVQTSNEAKDTEEDNKDPLNKSKTDKGKNKKGAKNINKMTLKSNTENENDEENIANQTSQLNLKENIGIDDNKDDDDDDDDNDWNATNKKLSKKSKNKSKANKNKSALNEQQQIKTPVEFKKETIKPTKCVNDLESEIPQHICATCNSKFESKNKLFSHLKLTNHGVYIPKPSTTNNDTKSKKSKGKRK